MASPITDDYAALATPWNPLPEYAMKEITSLQHKLNIDRGTKEGNTAKTDSIGTVISLNESALRYETELSDTESIDTHSVVSHDSEEVSGYESLGTASLGTAEMADMDIIDSIETDMDIIDSIENEAQMDVTKKTDTDIKCVAVSTCVSNSGDYRKIVSHVFGRNKACTRELPRYLWIFWCRKHYQRFKYRAENNGNWHYMQLRLVGQQLQIFQDWGHVRSWTVSLRKSRQATLAKEDESSIMHNNNVSTCWERCLVPFLGPKKTFADIRQILAAIERKFDEAEWCRYNQKLKSFPGIEFLPILHAHQKVSRVRKPAAKKGQSLYKKITLDQPAFNRKTRANLQYIKEKAQFIKERAAKKTQALNTPKGSRATFEKAKPLRSLLPKPPPTKRRRLMRGYEMHRSFDDEADTLIKTEDDEGRYEAW